MNFNNEQFALSFQKIEANLINRLGKEYYIRLAAIQSYLSKRRAIYRECSDKLFLYIFLSKALIAENYSAYNLHEGARIIPTIANLANKWSQITQVTNYEDKITSLVNIKNSRDVDATLFEILVAAKYIELGFEVEFIPETGKKKTPDLLITKNGNSRFVECKKMQRGNSYAYKELDRWYEISELIKGIILEHQITGHFHFRFSTELLTINPKRVLRRIRKKLDVCKNIQKPFYVFKHKDFKIRYTPIPFYKFNVDIDPLRNVTGPSFIHYLTDTYNPHLQYKCLCRSKEQLDPFIGNVEWASVLSYVNASWKSNFAKAQHMKRRLVDASKQLAANSHGDIHILIEECNGLNVYELRLLKNFDEITTVKDREGNVQRVYLHIAKYIVPLDQIFDVEETVMSFQIPSCKPESINSVWFPSDTIEEGLGTLMKDYL